MISLGDCLDIVLKKESKQWNQHNIEESAKAEHSPCLGTTVLKHGNAVRNIHSYFSNLEYRKCCLNLVPGYLTTFSNMMRLVKPNEKLPQSEYSTVNQPKLRKAADLTVQELSVLRHALLCAQYPQLCAPQPPTTPLSPTVKTFTAHKISAPILEGVPIDVNDNDESSSLIQPENLCEHLRCAYGLTTDVMQLQEKKLREIYGKRSLSKILVEELVNQLSALENNRHPFYNPKNFMSRNGYDLWQQSQRHQIMDLISKVWGHSLPPPSGSQVMDLQSIHEDYRLLQNTLLRYDNEGRQPGHIPSIHGAIFLSLSSQRLLKEFALRYGIGELYQQIIYLQYLVEHYDSDTKYVLHVYETLTRIRALLPGSKTRVIMVKQEYDILLYTIAWLHDQTGNFLNKMKRLYPENKPAEAVECLIHLLSSLLEIESYLTEKTQKSTAEWLHYYVERSFETAYERHKFIATSQLNMDPFELSPKLLNVILMNIRDEVTDYKQNYQATFERYFDISGSSALAFYGYLMADVIALCEQRTEQTHHDEIDLLMVSLAYRLHQLDMEWTDWISSDLQTWRPYFAKKSLNWLDVMESHLQKLVLQSVGCEKFETLRLHPDMIAALNDKKLGVEYDSFLTSRHMGGSVASLNVSVHSAFNPLVASGTHSSKENPSAVKSRDTASRSSNDSGVLDVSNVQDGDGTSSGLIGRMNVDISQLQIVDNNDVCTTRDDVRSYGSTETEDGCVIRVEALVHYDGGSNPCALPEPIDNGMQSSENQTSGQDGVFTSVPSPRVSSASSQAGLVDDDLSSDSSSAFGAVNTNITPVEFLRRRVSSCPPSSSGNHLPSIREHQASLHRVDSTKSMSFLGNLHASEKNRSHVSVSNFGVSSVKMSTSSNDVGGFLKQFIPRPVTPGNAEVLLFRKGAMVHSLSTPLLDNRQATRSHQVVHRRLRSFGGNSFATYDELNQTGRNARECYDQLIYNEARTEIVRYLTTRASAGKTSLEGAGLVEDDCHDRKRELDIGVSQEKSITEDRCVTEVSCSESLFTPGDSTPDQLVHDGPQQDVGASAGASAGAGKTSHVSTKHVEADCLDQSGELDITLVQEKSVTEGVCVTESSYAESLVTSGDMVPDQLVPDDAQLDSETPQSNGTQASLGIGAKVTTGVQEVSTSVVPSKRVIDSVSEGDVSDSCMRHLDHGLTLPYRNEDTSEKVLHNNSVDSCVRDPELSIKMLENEAPQETVMASEGETVLESEDDSSDTEHYPSDPSGDERDGNKRCYPPLRQVSCSSQNHRSFLSGADSDGREVLDSPPLIQDVPAVPHVGFTTTIGKGNYGGEPQYVQPSKPSARKLMASENVRSPVRSDSSPVPIRSSSSWTPASQRNDSEMMSLSFSSSVVDLLVLIHRLTMFAETLCKTLCPTPEAIPEPTKMEDNDKQLGQLQASVSPSSQSSRTLSPKTPSPHAGNRSGQWSTRTAAQPVLLQWDVHDMAVARRDIYSKVIQTMDSVLCIYADNMLCMDICAMLKEDALRLLGEEAILHLTRQKQQGNIWGCRHMSVPHRNCFQYNDNGAELLADRFEPINQQADCYGVQDLSCRFADGHGYDIHSFTGRCLQTINGNATSEQKMCTRINNLTCLLDILPQLQQKLADVVCLNYVNKIIEDALSSRETTPAPGINTPVSEGHQMSVGQQALGGLAGCVKHLRQAVTSLLKVLAYKVNLFAREALNLLLYLEIPWNTPIEVRLQPLTDFLNSHLRATSQWLTQASFRCFLEQFWVLMIENFEQEVDLLKRSGKDTEIQAEIMLNCIAFLIKFMNNSEEGLSLELLMSKADNVLFWLQLYTHPTNKLLALYYQVLAVHAGLETNNLNLSELPPKDYLERMRHELHSVRKCFSGRQLVDWMLENNIEQDGSSDLSGHMSPAFIQSKDYIQGLAQTMLDKGLLVSVDEDIYSHDGNQRKFSYPHLTECARPHSAFLPEQLSTDTGLSSTHCSNNKTHGVANTLEVGAPTEPHTSCDQQALIAHAEALHHNPQSCQACSVRSRPRAATSFHQTELNTGQLLKVRHKSEPEVCRRCTSVPIGLEGVLNAEPAAGSRKSTPQFFHRSVSQTPETSGYKSATSYVTSDRLSTPMGLSSADSDVSNNPLHFYCSHTHYYRFSSIQDDNASYSAMRKTNLPEFIEKFRQFPVIRTHLPNMLEMCREKHIAPKFILTIVYTRMKTDELAKAFMQMLPKEVLLDIKGEPSIFGCWWL